MHMFDLTTIGDIKLDVFIDLGNDAKVSCDIDKENCVMQIKYGEKIPVDSAVTMMAGSAPNISIGGRRLGASSNIISVVGEDTTATLAIDGLKKHGIPTENVTIAKGTQSSFSAILNFEGESTLLAVHRPHKYTLPEKLDTDWLFITELGHDYKKLFNTIVDLKNKKDFRIGINPGAIQIEEHDDALMNLIKHSDLLIVNKDEAQDLCACDLDEPKPLLRTLKELGPKTVIMTDGREGAYATDNGTVYYVPMFPGERVEATGAGDSFATGVLGALIAKQDLGTALAWGSVNSASVVQYVGPQEGLLTRDQINTFLKDNPNYKVITI
jgi:ribokinase